MPDLAGLQISGIDAAIVVLVSFIAWAYFKLAPERLERFDIHALPVVKVFGLGLIGARIVESLVQLSR